MFVLLFTSVRSEKQKFMNDQNWDEAMFRNISPDLQNVPERLGLANISKL